MRRLHLVLMAAALLPGCHVLGPRVTDFAFTQGPQGVAVTATTARGPLAAELLAVEDTGLLLLTTGQGGGGRRVVLLDYRAIRAAACEKLGREYVLDGQPPGTEKRLRLQGVSRFPQGVSADLRRQLLAAYGQAEVETVRP